MFVLKIPRSKHAAFVDWADRFDRYKEALGIESEHYLTHPLPEGIFEGWRGLEKPIGAAAGVETWILLERYKSRGLRTRYLNTRDDPKRVALFDEMRSLTVGRDQIMNEFFPRGWAGFRD